VQLSIRCAVLAFWAASAISSTFASGAAFTYQGELTDGGAPANGSYDLQFGLWDADAGGSQIGATQIASGVQVVDGKFTVELDFGASAFDNSGRWLEITVNGFTLAPRTPITRSPYSIQTRGIFVDDDGRVGIGTTDPVGDVHIAGNRPQLRLDHGGANVSGFTRLWDYDGGRMKLMKYADSSYNAMMDLSPMPGTINNAGRVRFFRDTNTGGEKVVQFFRGDATQTESARIGVDGYNSYFQLHGGNLGVGTDSPITPLDVVGNARFQSRVGIGTSAPAAPLDVNGNAYFRTRVGIGIWNPSASLDVFGDSTFRNRLRIGTTATDLYGQLTIKDSGDGSVFAIDASSSNAAFPTIYALNSGSGPVLWAAGTDDVSQSGGGVIVVGDQAGANVAIDGNEIMARDGGATSTLHLNAEGGQINMGLHDIHPAFAYGKIRSDGVIISASSNVTGVAVSTGKFTISIAGGVASTDVVVATDARFNRPTVMNAWVNNGKIEISCWNPVDNWENRDDVSFVVYRP
jgi:hypothetical protein